MIGKNNSLQSKIAIGCRKEGNRTLLTDSFFTMPYKLSHYGRPNAEPFLEMIQMCYSPGVMDGDTLQMEISCEAGTEMKLFTQSYNKIHPMPTRAGARQQLQVTLQSNALLQYVPHPAMPYAGSIFRACLLYTSPSPRD